MRSTHDRGEYEGFSPTGKETEMTAIVIHRIADGKIELVVLSIPRGCFARRSSSAEPRLHPYRRYLRMPQPRERLLRAFAAGPRVLPLGPGMQEDTHSVEQPPFFRSSGVIVALGS